MSGSTKKSKTKIKKCMETNEHENTVVQNLWFTAKAVLRWKFIQAYLMQQEYSQINNLNLNLKEIEKGQQTKSKSIRRKKEILERETKKHKKQKTTEWINENRSWFFEKINKIDKPLARLIKITERSQIKSEMKQKKPTLQGTKRIVKEYYENLYANKLDHLEEMSKIPGTYNHPKLNQKERGNLNRSITSKEIESVIKKFPTNRSPGPDGFKGEFYQIFKEELIPILPKLFQKIENEGKLPNLLYEASITLIPKPDKHTTKKRELQTSISDEYRCKNPQQNTSNRIQQYIKKIIHHNQVGFILGLQGGSIIANQCDISHQKEKG